MKHRFPLIGILIACLLLLSSAGGISQAQPLQHDPQPGDLTTPQLLDAAVARGELDQETADLYLAYALFDHERLPEEYRNSAPWHGTLPLLRLQERTAAMRVSATRMRIEALLSVACGGETVSLPSNTTTTHFYVDYGTIGGGLSISNYTTSLETAWGQEITTFGWASPPLYGSTPLNGRYQVRIDALGGGLYGYVTTGTSGYSAYVGDNPNTAWNDGDAYITCMVLNNDYSGFPGTSQQALDATTAHEFNHSIQFGYGALSGSNLPDDVLIEGGTTWMEDEVFDAANDNYNYLWPVFTTCMGEYTTDPYPYWITFRGLTERYGTGSAGAGEEIMQDFWEYTSQNTYSNLEALHQALVNKGTSLADAYHAYAIAVKFLRPCGGGYVYPYCFEEASGYLAAAGTPAVQGTIASVGGSYSGSVADNYALNWVALPANGAMPYHVTLNNTSAGGTLRGSVVCNTGSALTVTPFPATVGGSGSSQVLDYDPSGCTSVVAVITNQYQTAANPPSCTPRSYTLQTAVAVPPYEVEAAIVGPAGAVAQSGTTVTYTVQITNRGSNADTFDLTVASNPSSWTPSLAPTVVGPLAYNASSTVEVSVLVPPTAVEGESAQTTVTVTSRGDTNQSDSVVLTTLIPNHFTYLPLTMKTFGSTACDTTVANGDFESGFTVWSEYSFKGWPLIIDSGFPVYVTPHGGSWATWLGGDDNEVAYIEQQLTVPGCAPYLSYDHWIDSSDSYANDWGKVMVDGTTVASYSLYSTADTGGWVQYVVDLSAYADQTVWLQIRVETNDSTISSLFIDDVSFQSSATAR